MRAHVNSAGESPPEEGPTVRLHTSGIVACERRPWKPPRCRQPPWRPVATSRHRKSVKIGSARAPAASSPAHVPAPESSVTLRAGTESRWGRWSRPSPTRPRGDAPHRTPPSWRPLSTRCIAQRAGATRSTPWTGLHPGEPPSRGGYSGPPQESGAQHQGLRTAPRRRAIPCRACAAGRDCLSASAQHDREVEVPEDVLVVRHAQAHGAATHADVEGVDLVG